MSKTIDRRVAQLDFENSGFEKNIARSEDSLKKFNDALNKTDGGGMNQLGGIAGGVMGKFSVLGAIATGALMKIGNQAVVAGQQLLKSLTLDQITAGFGEYELKINSIKTILASGRTAEGLPVTLDQVNQKLEELNNYADQTIYSFSDMTSNIGKFTNAGVNLDLAVASIQGISNAAALAGASSWDASRAMYNFAQALSAGYVKLIDWKSIETANMATVDFKTELLEAAVAAGTLEKTTDGLYKVLSGNGMDEPISATKYFNESLQEQWMTTEVLTTTLAKYADETTEIGAKATEAAQKVRTFSQLMDTTKEALGSGWAMTFEHIFGDFKEASELWSNISSLIGTIVGQTSAARNEMVELWSSAGVFKAVLYNIDTPIKSLWEILQTVTDAFKEIFPPKTKFELVLLAQSIREFLNSLVLTEEQLDKIKTIFKGVFSALQLGWNVIKGVIKGLVDGIKQVFDMIPKKDGADILSFFARLGDWFIKLNESAKKAGTFVAIAKAIADTIVLIATKIKDGMKALKDSKFFTESLKNIFTKFQDWSINLPKFEKVGDFFQGFSDKLASMKGVSTEGLDKLHDSLKTFFTYVGDKLSPIWEFLKGVFDKIKTFFADTWKTEGLSGFLKIATGFAVGGAGYGILDFFKSMAGIGDGVGGAIENISGIFDGLKGTLETYQETLNAQKLQTIAIAIGILALALLVLTLLPSDKLLSASTAITVLFANLGAAMVVLDKSGGGGFRGAANMLILASAVFILALALKQLDGVDPNSILAMSVVIAELIASMMLLSKGGGNITGAATGMMGLALAVILMAGAAKIFATMKPEELQQGITAISVLMAEMLIFSVVMGQMGTNALGIAAAGLAMGIIAIALLELTGVVAILATMSVDDLTKSIGALGAMMALLAIGMIAIANPQVLFGAAAMILIAAALAIFVPSLLMLGSLPLEVIGKGLLAIAGIFAILGIAGMVLAPVVPVIAALAVSIFLIGLATLAAGAGLMLFGTGLALVAAGGAGAIAVMIFGIKEFLKLIPFAVTQIGNGFMAFLKIIINNAPLIGQAVLTILTTVLTTIGKAIPLIVETILNLLTTLLTAITERLPDFIQAGFDLLLAFLQGIADNIQQVIEIAADILINFMDGIAAKIPEIIQSGVDIITAFLEGIGDATIEITNTAFQVIIDFINGLATAIETNTPLLLEACENLATAFLDGVKSYLKIEEGETIAGYVVQGLINGITNGIADVLAAAKDLGRGIIDAINEAMGNESPSKETYASGRYADEGLINGLLSLSGKVISAAKGVGTSAVEGIKSTISGISDVLNSEVQLNPVITPVMDLSNIKNDAETINGLLNSTTAYNLANSQSLSDLQQNAIVQTATTQDNQPLGQNVQFVQNNYSPKALSQLEIYRQTKNQLAMLKGLVTP